MKNVILFIITTLLLVVGQGLWKIASSQFLMTGETNNLLLKLVSSIPFITGCCFYGVATGLWIYLLGQYEYSRIYPVFVGTCVILSMIVGIVCFKEQQYIIHKIMGSVIILFGIYILVR